MWVVALPTEGSETSTENTMRSKAKTLSLICVMTAIGCTQQTGSDELLGKAVVALTHVPSDVACVRVSAAGVSRSESRDFDVEAGDSSSELRLSGLPLGRVTFEALAFAAACDDVSTLSVADWTSDSVVAELRAGEVAQVALRMQRNGLSTVSIDFPEEENSDNGMCESGAIRSFRDDFDGDSLSADWTVWEYQGERHNSQSTPANHIALESGVLRYTVDPMTYPAAYADYVPRYDGVVYTYDPGLEVSRPLSGTEWTLEVGATWYVPLVINAAGFNAEVHFGAPGSQGFGCEFLRYSNDDTGSGVPSNANVMVASCWSGQSWTEQAPLEPTFGRQVRFTRANDRITIQMSADGTTWQSLVTSDPLPEEVRCAEQRFQISGSAWFSPRGSYADYDYVEFTPATQE